MAALTWKRGKVETTFNTGGAPWTVTHTTHTATLSNGREVMVKSVDGTFFFYLDGEPTHSFADTLKDAKAIWQRVEDRVS